MKCIISGGNIKILARAIHMLAKIGDEMFVHPQSDCISFRSVNASNSAYADITFNEHYFSYYAFEDMEENYAHKCKILIRSALAVFKTPSILDKQVDSCHIKLEANSEKLCFVLKYKNNITKTHLLPILDCETINATYKKDGTANYLCIQPKVMADVVHNFNQSLLEITLEVLQEKILIRNYIDEYSNVSNGTRTQLVFGVGEFEEYTIASNTIITFCLKELRAILSFAESISQPVNISFDNPGRPVVFVLKSAAFETNLVLATLNPDVDSQSQSTTSIQPIPKKTIKRSTKKPLKGIKSFNKKLLDDNREEANTSRCQKKQNSEDHIENGNSSLRSTDLISDPGSAMSRINRLQFNKQNVGSSTISKRKSEYQRSITPPNEFNNDDNNDTDEMIQNSPPRHKSKKAKIIFQKCFQTTFDPDTLPGHNNIEVEDSEDEMEE